jgi:hypothetical protein
MQVDFRRTRYGYLDAEVLDATTFKPALSAFYMATSGDRDAKIQAAVRIRSEERAARGGFR